MTGRTWKAGIMLALAGALAACADGYPGQDGALILSHDMKLDRALGAMHHLGHQRHLAHHWHYELQPGCVLQAQARRFLRDHEPVRVVPAGESEGVLVLDGVDAHDAAQMKWLVDFLPRHCAAGP